MEATGKLIQVTEIQEGTSRTGNPWKKRFYIIETNDSSYPKKIAFTVFGSDRVNQFETLCNVGDNVRVSFDLESREYNGRFYTDASAWRIERLQDTAASVQAPAATVQAPADAPVPPVSGADDDLPF